MELVVHCNDSCNTSKLPYVLHVLGMWCSPWAIICFTSDRQPGQRQYSRADSSLTAAWKPDVPTRTLFMKE